MLTAVLVVFLAGSSDRVDVLFGLSYSLQIWIYRVLFFVGPLVAAVIAHRVCIELRRGEAVRLDAARAELEARAAAAAAIDQRQTPPHPAESRPGTRPA